MGRDGIRDNGQGSLGRVHYSNNYNNAFWSDSCFCMTYGDGDGRTLGPLVALDVVAHEMSHGVTSSTSGALMMRRYSRSISMVTASSSA